MKVHSHSTAQEIPRLMEVEGLSPRSQELPMVTFNEPNKSCLQTTTHFNIHFNIIPSSTRMSSKLSVPCSFSKKENTFKKFVTFTVRSECLTTSLLLLSSSSSSSF
jgi:hypothetical protein